MQVLYRLALSAILLPIGTSCLPETEGGQGGSGSSPRIVSAPSETVQEVEPNGDTPQALPMNSCVEAEANGAESEGDYDLFELDLAENTHYQIEIADWSSSLDFRGRPDFAVAVDGAETSQSLSGYHSRTRDLYAGDEGEYVIYVADYPSLGPHAPPPFHERTGEYTLCFTEVEPRIARRQFPTTIEGDWSDRRTSVVSLTLDEPTVVVVDTMAERHDPRAQFFASLVVWDQTRQTLVALNNRGQRIDMDWVSDPRVSFRAEPNIEYHVFVVSESIESVVRGPADQFEYDVEIFRGTEQDLESPLE